MRGGRNAPRRSAAAARARRNGRPRAAAGGARGEPLGRCARRRDPRARRAAPGHRRRALPRAGAARPRRHGQRLRGRGSQARSPRRAEGAAARAGQRGPPPPLRARGAHARGAPAPGHRPRVLDRGVGRRALHRDGARLRPDARRADPGARDAALRAARRGDPAHRRARRRPRARCDPPRPEARQRDGHRRRPRQGARLRRRQVAQRGGRERREPRGDRGRNAVLHVAGAGRGARGRPAHRPVRARHPAVPDEHGRAAVPRRERRFRDPVAAARHAADRYGPAAAPARGAQPHREALPGEGQGAALPDGARGQTRPGRAAPRHRRSAGRRPNAPASRGRGGRRAARRGGRAAAARDALRCAARGHLRSGDVRTRAGVLPQPLPGRPAPRLRGPRARALGRLRRARGRRQPDQPDRRFFGRRHPARVFAGRPAARVPLVSRWRWPLRHERRRRGRAPRARPGLESVLVSRRPRARVCDAARVRLSPRPALVERALGRERGGRPHAARDRSRRRPAGLVPARTAPRVLGSRERQLAPRRVDGSRRRRAPRCP